MERLEFIYKRHSVRKFKDTPVPLEDIREIIKGASYAPSAKNLQNWHFLVVTDKEKIKGIADVIRKKNSSLAEKVKDDKMRRKFEASLGYQTFIEGAPVVILIFAHSYRESVREVLEENGVTRGEIEEFLRSSPGIQSVGGAIENLHLAAASLGYGTCWMTAPNYAAREIQDYLAFRKGEYFLVAMTPLGLPLESEAKSPPRKSLAEIMTII